MPPYLTVIPVSTIKNKERYIPVFMGYKTNTYPLEQLTIEDVMIWRRFPEKFVLEPCGMDSEVMAKMMAMSGTPSQKLLFLSLEKI